MPTRPAIMINGWVRCIPAIWHARDTEAEVLQVRCSGRASSDVIVKMAQSMVTMKPQPNTKWLSGLGLICEKLYRMPQMELMAFKVM